LKSQKVKDRLNDVGCGGGGSGGPGGLGGGDVGYTGDIVGMYCNSEGCTDFVAVAGHGYIRVHRK